MSDRTPRPEAAYRQQVDLCHSPNVRERLAEVLRAVEWRGGCAATDNHWPHCPSCGAPSPDCEYADGEDGPPCGEHMPDCDLAVVLAAYAALAAYEREVGRG